jgi:general secretion pathway protein K
MRCADRPPQTGAAIILAMLAVALAASVAASVLANFGHSLERASGRHDQNQARLLARGAVDWARNVLADDMQRTSVDHLKEAWAIRIPPTPVGEGEVGGEILDRSGLFNINNLLSDGKPDRARLEQFGRLLVAIGISSADASALVHAVETAIARQNLVASQASGQSDNGTAAASPAWPLADIGELRATSGFDDALLNRLRPFVTALPAPSRINVNTATPEVLAALVSGLDLNAARLVVAQREHAWFRDFADFSARLPSSAQAPGAQGVDVKSRHFLVTGRSRFGIAVVGLEVLLDRRETWPAIIWQRIL